MTFNDLGYGAPFTKIYFESKDGTIELQERVEDFTYTYNDDDGDTLAVTIKSDIPTLPDEAAFQEKAKWVVKWGYIGGAISKERTVFVRDVDPTFNKEGLTMVIRCSDKAAIAKENASKNCYDNQSALDIAKDVATNNDLGLKVDDGEKEYTILEVNNNRSEGYNVNSPLKGSTNATYNTFTKRPLIEQTFVKQESNVQGNKNDIALIKDTLAKDPSGPWLCDSRDEYLIIRKRNLHKKPVGVYYYRHDEGTLISFKPETKNESHGKSGAKLSTGIWDSLDKAYSEVSTLQQLDKNESLMGDNVRTDLVNGSTRTYQNIEYAETIKPWKPATENTSIIILGTEEQEIKKDDTLNNPDAAGGLGPGLSRLSNNRRNQALKTNPATATLVGNPILESSDIISFLGVAKKFAGNYYACEVIHRINFNIGYLVDTKMLKNSTGITGNDPDWLVNGKDFGLTKSKELGDFWVIPSKEIVEDIDPTKP